MIQTQFPGNILLKGESTFNICILTINAYFLLSIKFLYS